MIDYVEPVIRPPAEADSLILQATTGCSHNSCIFCPTYKKKKFRTRSFANLVKETAWAAQNIPNIRRVFLGDGDALAIPADNLKRILDMLYSSLPELKRVSAYASPGNFSDKKVCELEQLRQLGLSLVYIGFESGDDEVLRRVKKGFTSEQIGDLSCRCSEAGIKISATVIIGLGGPSLSKRHAENTAMLINRVKPRFASALTLMLPFGEERYRRQFGTDSWRLLKPAETLAELKCLVSNIDENGIIFRSNHASNYLALAGTFQKSKKKMLDQIDLALEHESYRPEFLRGL